MKRSTKSSVVLTMAATLALSFATLAAAQSDAASELYVSAATVPTNIAGIHTYAASPNGLNPVTATDEELATYGFPPRPDKQADAEHYALWERAMLAAKIRWNGDLKPIPSSGRGMMPASQPSSQETAAATVGPTKVSTFNWSGVALTNKLTKWSATSSFNDIYSVFTVPTSQLPFGASQCDSPAWFQLSWVGIDGYNPFLVANGALQGGMMSVINCGGSTPSYSAFVGWGFPNTVFQVNPGDIMYVEVSNGLGGLNPGTVFIEDLSTLTYNSYSVPAPNNLSPLVGNSAQWVVERLCCLGANPYPLINTIGIFFDGGAARTGNGHLFYPGSSATSTVVMTMRDDGNTQDIEIVNRGSSGYQGLHALWLQDVGCTFTPGCVI